MGRPTSKRKSGLYAMKGPRGSVPQLSRNFDPAGTAHGAPGLETFVDAEAAPQSTFSIDVDTGSYSLMRRDLSEGNALPPPGRVRSEEMVNYFDYAYPEPTGDVPLSVTSEVGPCPWDTTHRLVHVGVQGRHIAVEKTPARNLVSLIDVSGSMSAQLPLVISSLGFLTEQLGAEDTISVVVYAGAAGTVLPPTAGSEKSTILAALARLSAGGSTNGGEGIHLAYRLAEENFVEGGINRVMVATDGDFNVGVTGHAALVDLIETKRESGVFLSVLGYGGSRYRDGTMEQLADKGNGNYAFIDGPTEARKVLVEQAGSTLVTIAKDVKIQVEFDPALVARYRLVGYANRRLDNRDFADDTKDAGEIGAGHTVTALYEVEPAGPTTEGTLMQLGLRYKDPDGDVSRLVRAAVRDTGAALEQTSDAFRFSAAVAGFAEVLGTPSADVAADGLLAIRDLAAAARGDDPRCRRAEFVRLVEAASALRGTRLTPTALTCVADDVPQLLAHAHDSDDDTPFDWGRFVLNVLSLLPPLMALPLFVVALRRKR